MSVGWTGDKGTGKGFGNATRLDIDARHLGRPDKFDGTDSTFKDWSVVLRSSATLANSDIGAVLKAAGMGNALRKFEMSENERMASIDLYHLLLNLCTSIAFAKVVNAAESEGALAWKSIIDRWDPKMRTRQAGILLGVFKWSFLATSWVGWRALSVSASGVRLSRDLKSQRT